MTKFTCALFVLIFSSALILQSCGENTEKNKVIDYYKGLYEQLKSNPNAIPDNSVAQKAGFKDDIEAVAAALKYMNDSDVDSWAKKYAFLNDSIVKVKACEAEKMINDINNQSGSGNDQMLKEMDEAEKEMKVAEKAMEVHSNIKH